MHRADGCSSHSLALYLKALGLYMYLGLNIGYPAWCAFLCYSDLTASVTMLSQSSHDSVSL